MNMEFKTINCNVHGVVQVSPMALKIIDTPEFQRMRNISQTGLCHYVYPAATHTRFEHSIGVYHLTGKMTERIRQLYPEKKFFIHEFGREKKLTKKLEECIKIAGLCHDIGHGPFSHIFDNILLNDSTHPNKEHEVRSCLIVEMLCRRELRELDQKYINFIKSIIKPQPYHIGALYQIVSNNLNGIDVDKFDYIMRDSKNLGILIGFDPYRLINEFIIDANNNIAYPEHCSINIYEMFYGRYILHKKCYCHKTVKLLEFMLKDFFAKIDPVFKISESINDMSLFCKLTDDVIFHYVNTIISPPSFLKINVDSDQYKKIIEAYNIYERIITRKLYQEIAIVNGRKAEYFKEFVGYLLDKYSELSAEDFDMAEIRVGFVKENVGDPFMSIFFYGKRGKETFTMDRTQISNLMGGTMEDVQTIFICKRRDYYDRIISELERYEKKCF
ncbi:MAG: HD domain-containing protein [Thermoplasmata archaeon]